MIKKLNKILDNEIVEYVILGIIISFGVVITLRLTYMGIIN